MTAVCSRILCLLILGSSLLHARDMSVIPQPVNASASNEKFMLRSGSVIRVNSTNREVQRIAAAFQATLHTRTGLALGVQQGQAASGINIGLSKKSGIAPDGYTLTVTTSRVTLNAATPGGIFYGIQTLNEILQKDGSYYFPGCAVEDFPAFGHRGLSFDASRHFQSVHFVKKVLDVMAALKLNVLHWHLVDDEGWRIESKKYPELNRAGSYGDSLNARERNGYYTVAEIRDVIAYARDRYIKVIPEVEMPGHSRSVMESYPQMLCPTNVKGNTYCAGKPANYEFLKNVLSEIVGIFGTDIIHVGGDERPKGIWEKCPTCKEMIATKKLANENMLQNYFMKDICTYLSSKGVRTIAWYENIGDGIPKGQIVQGWHPGESLDAARRGYYTINSDCDYAYFDYANSEYEKKFKPVWIPVLDLEQVYRFNPAPDSLKDSERKFILGGECALWTEVVLEKDVQYQLFPRLLAFAEDVWTPVEKKNFAGFSKRIQVLQPFIGAMGFEYDNGEKIINGK